MTTKAELISQVIDELKVDPNLRINSSILITRRLNSAIKVIQARAGFSFIENQDILTFSGNYEYVLPADFATISDPNSVKYENTVLSPATYHDLVARYDITAAGSPNYYYIRKDGADTVIGVYPQGQGTLLVPYNKRLDQIDDTTPSPLPDTFDDAIVYYTIYLLMKRMRGFEEKAREYLEHFNIEMRAALADMLKAKPLMMKSQRQREENRLWL